jgi:hypothetical protein
MDLEQTDDALAFRFADGTPLWCFCRFAVRRQLLNQRLHTTSTATTTRRTRPRGYWRRTLRHAALPFASRKWDVVFLTTGAGVSVQRYGCWVDRIHDAFVLEQPNDTLVLEPSYQGEHRRPRQAPHVRYIDMLARAEALAGLTMRAGAADERSVDALLRWLAPTKLAPTFVETLRADLVRTAATIGFQRRMWGALLDAVRPRVLIVEDGSYGGRAILLAEAHARGIVTGEPQHGIVPPNHHAYCAGPGIRGAPSLAPYFPRDILLYGSYWQSQLSGLSTPAVVGNPWFSLTRSRFRRNTDASSLLVASQPESAASLHQLSRALARNGVEVIFRPHPMERQRAAEHRALARDGVVIDECGDAYESLARVGGVVGTASTLLYEAAGVGLPVFVLDEPFSRHYVVDSFGTWVKDADELLARRRTASATVPIDDLFAADWRERWRSWLSNARGT